MNEFEAKSERLKHRDIVGKQYVETATNNIYTVDHIGTHAVIWDGEETGEYDVRVYLRGGAIPAFVLLDSFLRSYRPL